ncbi:class 1 fructose-bisphosphatase [bacterium]|nr:MAG: class 1 fructose-bisphosphatase [bacterium]
MIKVSRFITLDNFITKQENFHPGASGLFTSFMHDLTFAVRLISKEVRRAGINDIIGLTDTFNVHGEQVKKLDAVANEIIIKSMNHTGKLAVMASEENEELIQIPSKYEKGKYVLVFDPLDGSSNIDVNVTIGTIFGLYKRISDSNGDCGVEDVLQPGYKQIAAGYALYGSSTVFVYTTGNGVNAFTFDPTVGEFILTYEKITIPERGKCYSVNEGNSYKWSPEFKKYINYLKEKSEDGNRPYSSRYIGSGVADIHRTLLYGGIFAYPADLSNPQGKLRLVYECNPLAMLVEQAGGKATNGKERILDLKPTNIHQRSPLFLGSKYDVEECEAFLSGNK